MQLQLLVLCLLCILAAVAAAAGPGSGPPARFPGRRRPQCLLDGLLRRHLRLLPPPPLLWQELQGGLGALAWASAAGAPWPIPTAVHQGGLVGCLLGCLLW